MSSRDSGSMAVLRLLFAGIFMGSFTTSLVMFSMQQQTVVDIQPRATYVEATIRALEVPDVIQLFQKKMSEANLVIVNNSYSLRQQNTFRHEKEPGEDETTADETERRWNVSKLMDNPALFGIEKDDLDVMPHSPTGLLELLPDYKNPCWLETLRRGFTKQYRYTVYSQFAENHITAMNDSYSYRLTNASSSWRMRCLPYFYLMGVTKSGTTDLYDVIMRHPLVQPPWVKEPMYWNRHRYPDCPMVHKNHTCKHQSLHQFLNMFDFAAHRINQTVSTTSRHEHITGEGSSYLFWEDNGWSQHPENAGLTEPLFTTPMAIHALQPDAKFILILRDPTDRVYSAYTMYTAASYTVHQFDADVDRAIELYTDCFKAHGFRPCAYNASLSRLIHPVSLRGSLYSVFMKDWLAVFPARQILVIKSEEYYQNRAEHLEKVCQFLHLPQLPDEQREQLVDKRAAKSQDYPPMLSHTRWKLDEFFRPFIQQLHPLTGISW